MAKKIVALVGDGIGPEIMEALAEKQVLTMRLTDDRSEVQILMQQDLPYLMKPLRQVGKQMLSY